MDEEWTNRVWPAQCRHVGSGELPEIERMTLTTVEPHDEDYRYVKGPDAVRICAFCAGKLWGYFSKECE